MNFGDENDLSGDLSQDLSSEETGDEGFEEAPEETDLSEEEFGEEDESEDEEEEQSDEDQDDSEEEDEEEEQEEKPAFKFKDSKTGNFDWSKINQRLGGPELEKSFKESQKTITRFSQENKELKGQLEGTGQKAQLFEQFDQLVRRHPEVQAAIQKAITGQAPRNPREEIIKAHPGLNPDDPVIPLLERQQQMIDQLLNQHQETIQQTQQAQRVENFRQGLLGAKGRFVELVGREPTEAELRSVAEKMRSSGHLNGQDWVPSLFVEEIRKGVKQQLEVSRKAKKSLPKSPKQGVRKANTSKSKSFKADFEEAWDQYGKDAD